MSGRKHPVMEVAAPPSSFGAAVPQVRRRVGDGSPPARTAPGRLSGIPLTLDVADVATRSLMDRVRKQFDGGPDHVGAAMYELQFGLADVKANSDPAVWKDVAGRCKDHPLGQLLWQDPFTRRSF